MNGCRGREAGSGVGGFSQLLTGIAKVGKRSTFLWPAWERGEQGNRRAAEEAAVCFRL